MRYFEMFLAEHRLPAALAYQQIRSLRAEYGAAQRQRPSHIMASRAKTTEEHLDKEYRSEQSEKFTSAIAAIASSSGIELIFLLDQALELLRSDLRCDRDKIVGQSLLIPEISLFEALRALGNFIRHQHDISDDWDSWMMRTMRLLGIYPMWPNSLGPLEEFFGRLPFKTWNAFERCLVSDAKVLTQKTLS